MEYSTANQSDYSNIPQFFQVQASNFLLNDGLFPKPPVKKRKDFVSSIGGTGILTMEYSTANQSDYSNIPGC